jgi:hypothetical protein
MFGLSNNLDYWISNKELDDLVKLFVQKNCKCILYISNQEVGQNLQIFDYTSGLVFVALRFPSIIKKYVKKIILLHNSFADMIYSVLF